MDYGRLAGLYRQYLGRDPEPGAESWLQYDDGTIESSIANSGEAEEYRNRQSQPQQQPQPEPQPQQQPQAPSGLDDNAINQLYQQYLGRGADQGGLNTWRGQSYDQVLQGILNSGEYAQRILAQQTPAPTPEPTPAPTPEPTPAPTPEPTPATPSGLDENTINQLYQQYLGRNADQGGLDNWRGKSRDEVVSGIVNSGEYAERLAGQQTPAPTPATPSGLDDNAIRQLYQQYLGRDVDQGGLDTWRGKSRDEVIKGITNSAEYGERITNQQKPATPMNSGAGTNPVTQEPQSGLTDNQVQWLYKTYLGREPDPSGMNTFRGMDMAQAISRIASSEEYVNRQEKKQTTSPTGGVNWILDPNDLAKNAVRWDNGTYFYADGSSAYASSNAPNQAVYITPPYSSYEDPANLRLGNRNIAYAGSSVPEKVTINGVEVDVQKPEYLINGKTGKVFTDPEKGNRTYTILDVTPQNQSGELYKVFDSTVKIGAAIMISFAAPEIGAGILSSTLTGAEAAAYAASIANGMTSAQALAATGAYTAGQAAAVGAAVASTGNQAMIDAVNEKNGKAILDAAATTLGTTALSYGISTAAGSLLPTGLPSTVAGGATGAVRGTVTAILGGKDPISGLGRGTISGLTSGAIKDIQTSGYDLQGDDQVFDTEEQRYLSPYEVSVKYPELYPEGIPVEERTFGEKLAGTTATTLAGALSSYFFPSTKPSTGSKPTSGRTVTPSTGAKEVIRETTQPTARSPTSQPAPMMATSSASPATSSYFGPSTAALGQALNTGSVSLASGGGGDQGSTGQDISEESGAAPKRKWVNAQSLRDLDEIGS